MKKLKARFLSWLMLPKALAKRCTTGAKQMLLAEDGVWCGAFSLSAFWGQVGPGILTYRYLRESKQVSISIDWYRWVLFGIDFQGLPGIEQNAGKPLWMMRGITDVKVTQLRKGLAFLSIP